MGVVPLRGAAADGTEPFEIVNPSQWQDKEPPRYDWVVEDLFLRGTVAMVSGDGGIGKSLLMQQLCSSSALGRDWLGFDVKSGPALMLACEDDGDELWRRQARINMDLCCSMNEVGEGGLMLKPRVGQDNNLVFLDRNKWVLRPTAFFDKLWDFCVYEGVKILCIDTATATYSGNQNDENMVTTYISLLRGLAIRIQGLVIITKHPSLAGRSSGSGESGSVTWNNTVRARCYLHKDKSGQLVLETMKTNYGAKGAIPLRWSSGVFVKDADADYSQKWL